MFNISPLFSLFKVYYHNFPGKNTRSRERTRPPLPHFRLSLAPLIFKSEKIPAFHQFSFDFFENTSILKGMFRASLSSRGLGHRVFIPATRVRIPMGMPILFSPSNILARMRLFSRYGIIWGHIWGHKCPEEGTHSDGHVYNDETRGAVFSDASAQSTG